MFRQIGAPEIILILVVLLLLFGAKRLPDLSRSVGRSLRIFKSEVKEMRTDDEPERRPDATDHAPRQIEARGAAMDEAPGRQVTDDQAPDTGRRES